MGRMILSILIAVALASFIGCAPDEREDYDDGYDYTDDDDDSDSNDTDDTDDDDDSSDDTPANNDDIDTNDDDTNINDDDDAGVGDEDTEYGDGDGSHEPLEPYDAGLDALPENLPDVWDYDETLNRQGDATPAEPRPSPH